MLQPMIRSFNLMGDNGEPFIAELRERRWQAPNDTRGPLKPLIAACNFPISLQKWRARPRGWAAVSQAAPPTARSPWDHHPFPKCWAERLRRSPGHCPCLYLKPAQGPRSLSHPPVYVALGMEGVCRNPRAPHPITTLSHHHCWPFCNLLLTSTLPVPPMNPSWSLSKESIHRFPGCQLHWSRRLPRPPHHHFKSPLHGDRGRRSWNPACPKMAGCWGFHNLFFPSLGSLASSVWHKTTRRPVPGALAFQSQRSANSRTGSSHTGQWALQAAESCSVLYCLRCEAASWAHTNTPPTFFFYQPRDNDLITAKDAEKDSSCKLLSPPSPPTRHRRPPRQKGRK